MSNFERPAAGEKENKFLHKVSNLEASPPSSSYCIGAQYLHTYFFSRRELSYTREDPSNKTCVKVPFAHNTFFPLSLQKK